MVRFDPQRESNPAVLDNEIAEAIDNHSRQVYESLFATVCKRKFIIGRIRCKNFAL